MAQQSGSIADLSRLLAGCALYELSHTLFPGMPVSPNHPQYFMMLARRHGDVVRDDGVTTANELIVMCAHTGTHVDALGHASAGGRMHGGLRVDQVQTGGRGLRQLGVETMAPILQAAALLDVPKFRETEMLEPAQRISVEELKEVAAVEGVDLSRCGVVLIRTGWARRWSDESAYLGGESGLPGPDLEAARWLADQGVLFVGSDTPVFEMVQPDTNVRPVHQHLLIDRGVHIVESLNLEELSHYRVTEFVFVALPLQIEGATGSPLRPVALVP